MKIKYIIIIIVIILIGIGGFCYMKYHNEDKIEEIDVDVSKIKSFHLSYSNGYMMNANIIYEFKKEEDKYIANIKPYLVADDDALSIELNIDTIENIVEVLKKYEVSKWDGFNKSDQGVLDGDSFSLYVWFENDKSIHASGYMKWPENYSNVRNEISDIFMEIYNNERGEVEDE